MALEEEEVALDAATFEALGSSMDKSANWTRPVQPENVVADQKRIKHNEKSSSVLKYSSIRQETDKMASCFLKTGW